MATALNKWRASGVSTGAASSATIRTVSSSSLYIYVTKIVACITTVANGKKSTFADSNSSPVNVAQVASLTVAAGANQGEPFVFEFPKGFKLTLGKNFVVTDEGSGCVVSYYAEGFERAF